MAEIEISLENEEPAEEQVTELAEKVEELSDKIEEKELEEKIEETVEEALEEALETNSVDTDRIERLETVIVALDQKLQDLEEAVIDVEEEIQADELRDVQNDLEHEIMEQQIDQVEDVVEDVEPEHAKAHILFADGKDLSERLKAWWNR